MHNGRPTAAAADDELQPLVAAVTSDGEENAAPGPDPGPGPGLARVGIIGWVGKQVASVSALLACVPLGFVASVLRWHPAVVLALNFLAIIPLSALVSHASDLLADSWGSLAGGLINATFGNAVELIVGILAIRRGEIGLAQSMMIGSILSDLLCMLGVCLIVAAGPWTTQHLNPAVADTLSSLITITAATLVLPTALYSSFRGTGEIHDKILIFSRATAVVLLLVYCVFIYFQMWSHECIFTNPDDHNRTPDTTACDAQNRRVDSGPSDEPSLPGGEQHIEANTINRDQQAVADLPKEAEETNLYAAAGLLASAVAVILWCTHLVIENVDGTVQVLHISKRFFAMIVLPIASNAPEFSTVIAASKKRHISFAIGVIAGSILQISLFVIPFLVLVGWFVGEDVTLYFDVSQTCIMFLAVLIVSQVLQEHAYTYLHGVMLLAIYATTALAYFVQPHH